MKKHCFNTGGRCVLQVLGLRDPVIPRDAQWMQSASRVVICLRNTVRDLNADAIVDGYLGFCSKIVVEKDAFTEEAILMIAWGFVVMKGCLQGQRLQDADFQAHSGVGLI